jgi:hypothetical protein
LFEGSLASLHAWLPLPLLPLSATSTTTTNDSNRRQDIFFVFGEYQISSGQTPGNSQTVVLVVTCDMAMEI